MCYFVFKAVCKVVYKRTCSSILADLLQLVIVLLSGLKLQLCEHKLLLYFTGTCRLFLQLQTDIMKFKIQSPIIVSACSNLALHYRAGSCVHISVAKLLVCKPLFKGLSYCQAKYYNYIVILNVTHFMRCFSFLVVIPILLRSSPSVGYLKVRFSFINYATYMKKNNNKIITKESRKQGENTCAKKGSIRC